MPVKIEVAEPKDRFVAAAIDFVPPFLLFLVFFAMDKSGLASLTALFGSIYLIFRDLIGNGQSLGKRFLNLQVIDADTDRVPDPMALILRNLGFGIPALNVAYAVAEGVQALRHPQHLRWGDIFAQTGVVKVPAEDRAKLLVRTATPDRPSGSGKSVVVQPPGPALDPTGATTPGMTPPPVPAAPLRTPTGSGSAPKPAMPRPTGSGAAAAAPRVTGSGPAAKPGVAPAAPPRPAASAPRKAPVNMDLPAEEPKKAAAPAPKPAAPKPVAKGVELDEDDPLKALIDQATAGPKPR